MSQATGRDLTYHVLAFRRRVTSGGSGPRPAGRTPRSDPPTARAFRDYEDPAALLRHLDEVGVCDVA